MEYEYTVEQFKKIYLESVHMCQLKRVKKSN